MEEIRKVEWVISCGQCHKPPKDPITLPCFHSLCRDSCFPTDRSRTFQCPVCFFEYDPKDWGMPMTVGSETGDQPGTGIFLIRYMVSALHPQEKSCERCQENQAEMFCVQCSSHLCGRCHPNGKDGKEQDREEEDQEQDGRKAKRKEEQARVQTRGSAGRTGHFTISMKDLEAKISLDGAPCPTHREYKRNMICHRCNLVVCEQCVKEDHSGHKCSIVTECVEGIRQKLKKMTDEIQAVDVESKKRLEEIENEEKELNENGEAIQKEISAIFQNVRDEIDRQEKKLVSELSSKRSLLNEKLQTEKTKIKNLMGSFESSNQFSQLLSKEASDLEVYLSWKQVAQRMKIIYKSYEEIETSSEKLIFDRGENQPLQIGRIQLRSEAIPAQPKEAEKQAQKDDPKPKEKDSKNTSKSEGKDGPQKRAEIPKKRIGSKEIEEPVKKKRIRAIQGTFGQTEPALVFGSYGSGDGEFSQPCSVCTNSVGDIIVADTQNHRIQVFDSEGNFLFKFGTQGSGVGQFKSPKGVTTDPMDHILVSDFGNHRIQFFDSKGGFLGSIGSLGQQGGKLKFPRGLSTDGHGNLFVAEYGNKRVSKFSNSGSFSGFIDQAEFTTPVSVVPLSTGKIAVADFSMHQAKILSEESQIAIWIGKCGAGDGEFQYPYHLAVDGEDNLFVCDSSNNRIQIFNDRGIFIGMIGSKWLSEPAGIAVDLNGRVVVSEIQGNRISVFVPDSGK